MDVGRTMDGGIDALISGKRRSPRHPVSLAAVVKAVRGEFRARVLDLSIEGARVAIPLEELGGTPGQALGPAEQFGLLEGHFRDSFDLHLPEAGVVMETQVVRLVVTSDDDEDVALGCRFVHPLSEAQQVKLGIKRDDDDALMPWGEATLLHDMRWIAREDRPVTGILSDEDARRGGPRFLGRVAAIGRRAVLILLEGVDSDEAISALVRPGIHARLLHGRAALCESTCEPVSVRYVDGPRPGVEVLLALADALPRGVRRRFRRA